MKKETEIDIETYKYDLYNRIRISCVLYVCLCWVFFMLVYWMLLYISRTFIDFEIWFNIICGSVCVHMWIIRCIYMDGCILRINFLLFLFFFSCQFFYSYRYSFNMSYLLKFLLKLFISFIFFFWKITKSEKKELYALCMYLKCENCLWGGEFISLSLCVYVCTCMCVYFFIWNSIAGASMHSVIL